MTNPNCIEQRIEESHARIGQYVPKKPNHGFDGFNDAGNDRPKARVTFAAFGIFCLVIVGGQAVVEYIEREAHMAKHASSCANCVNLGTAIKELKVLQGREVGTHEAR